MEGRCFKKWMRIVEQEQLLAFNSTPFCSRVRVAQSLVFFVLRCRKLLTSVSFFFRPLYCLSFFSLWLLITLFVSSNFSKLTYRLLTELRISEPSNRWLYYRKQMALLTLIVLLTLLFQVQLEIEQIQKSINNMYLYHLFDKMLF